MKVPARARFELTAMVELGLQGRQRGVQVKEIYKSQASKLGRR